MLLDIILCFWLGGNKQKISLAELNKHVLNKYYHHLTWYNLSTRGNAIDIVRFCEEIPLLVISNELALGPPGRNPVNCAEYTAITVSLNIVSLNEMQYYDWQQLWIRHYAS